MAAVCRVARRRGTARRRAVETVHKLLARRRTGSSRTVAVRRLTRRRALLGSSLARGRAVDGLARRRTLRAVGSVTRRWAAATEVLLGRQDHCRRRRRRELVCGRLLLLRERCLADWLRDPAHWRSMVVGSGHRRRAGKVNHLGRTVAASNVAGTTVGRETGAVLHDALDATMSVVALGVRNRGRAASGTRWSGSAHSGRHIRVGRCDRSSSGSRGGRAVCALQG